MSSPNQLSFLPDDYLERKAQQRTNFICAVLFLLVMGGIGSAFAISERNTRDVEQQHGRIEQQYTQAARRIEQFRQMQEKQVQMARQAELTASLLEKVPRSNLLAELTNLTPTGVSLLDFQLDSRIKVTAAPRDQNKNAYEMKKAEAESKSASVQPPPPQPKRYDVAMKLTGVAATDVQVAQYLARLNRSKLFKDVNLVISDEYRQADQKLRKFQVELTLNGEADVQSLPRANSTVAAPVNE